MSFTEDTHLSSRFHRRKSMVHWTTDLSCYCNKIPDTSHPMKKGLLWLTVWGYCLSQLEKHGGRRVRQLLAWHPYSGSKERWMLVLSPLSAFYSVQDPSPWDAAAHIRVGYCYLPNSLTACPKVCFYGESKSYHVKLTIKISHHSHCWQGSTSKVLWGKEDLLLSGSALLAPRIQNFH